MPHMSEADIRADRIKKIGLLTDAGMDPYPAKAEPTATIAQFLDTFDDRVEREDPATLCGRIMSSRGQGGIAFIDIYDGTGRVQAVLQKEGDTGGTGQFDLFLETVDTGDFIEVTGRAFMTNRGARSLKADSWRMIAKSLLPIPDSWYGLKDGELILRQRYLDMLVHDDVRDMFVRRSKFLNSMRTFLIGREFIEVETPVLETSPGGADARPFITHHNALNMDVYLRISAGELWQKRLLVGGYPKVFEIGRIFRNEGQSREHLQDYTQLEFYDAYKDYRDGMTFVQELYRAVAKDVYGRYSFEMHGHAVDFAENWEVIDFIELMQGAYGINPVSCTETEAVKTAQQANVVFGDAPNKARAIDGLWKLLRKRIAGPAFLVGVPIYMEPLAKKVAGSPDIVERFQVIIAGSEMGKGFSELNDPLDQRARFEEQQRLRDAGDDEAQRLDEDYVRAMEYGMPPSFGFGVSERLFAFMENRPAHETQMFPLLRPKQDS